MIEDLETISAITLSELYVKILLIRAISVVTSIVIESEELIIILINRVIV